MILPGAQVLLEYTTFRISIGVWGCDSDSGPLACREGFNPQHHQNRISTELYVYPL